MSAKVFLDTNVLVYAFGGRSSSTSTEHIEIAQQTVIAGGVISVQVLNEFVHVCRRKAGLPWPQIADSLSAIKELCGPALPITFETHELAVDLAMRSGYSIYDALILAAAIRAGCTTVNSEDMHHQHQIDGLTIVNPFRSN
jgi:predicted nucleic acid-binding protein